MKPSQHGSGSRSHKQVCENQYRKAESNNSSAIGVRRLSRPEENAHDDRYREQSRNSGDSVFNALGAPAAPVP